MAGVAAGCRLRDAGRGVQVAGYRSPENPWEHLHSTQWGPLLSAQLAGLGQTMCASVSPLLWPDSLNIQA